MPTASLLLLPLKRLLSLIPSALGLLPVLLRPPAPPFGHVVPGHTGIQSSCPAATNFQPKCAPPRHPSYPRTRVSTPTTLVPQSHQKSSPPQPKSFLEKTLTAREAPKVARFSRSRQQPNSGSARRLLLPRCVGTGCAVEAAQPRTSADRPWPSAPNDAIPRPELDRLRGRSCPAPDVSRPPVAVGTEPGVLQPGADTACGRSCPASSFSRPPMAAFVGCSGQNLESVIT